MSRDQAEGEPPGPSSPMGLEVGRTLLHYRVVEMLGAGGMGQVYAAEDTKLGRLVALKVLPGEVASDPERLKRFRREARALAALNHPNIVTIHSVEEAEGVHFLTMERLEGVTLAHKIPSRGMPLGKLCAIGLPIADALAAAHQHGIVHRDLKPENVIVGPDERVKVLDFGLAKLGHEGVEGEAEATAETLTEAGHLVGTLPYMSPEQLQGQPVDSRSDIFSFGTLLFEMAVGRRPFQGKTLAELLTSILRDTPSSLTQTRPELPAELGRIVHRCLAKDPRRRYQSTLDLRNDLEALSQEGTDPRHEVTRDTSSAPRRRALAWTGAAAVVVGLAILLVTLTPWNRRADVASNVVVVAGFENRTGDESLAHLGPLAVDWITLGLFQAGTLEVVPTPSSFADAKLDLTAESRRLAETAGARIVVSGAYYLQGGGLQFQARVVDALEGKLLLAAGPVRGSLEDPQRAVEELRQQILTVLVENSDPRNVLGGFQPATAFEAYREYMAAAEFFGKDYVQAIRHYERAIRTDPEFMAPRFMLAWAYWNIGDLSKTEALVRELDEDRVRLNPYEVYNLDYLLANLQGEMMEELRIMRRAQKSFPKDRYLNYSLGQIAYLTNRPRETVETYGQLADPGLWNGDKFGEWRSQYLALAHHLLGNYQRELDEIRWARQHFPTFSRVYDEARALAALGRVADLDKAIDESLSSWSQADEYTPGDLMRMAALELRTHDHAETEQEVLSRGLEWYRHLSPNDAATQERRLGLAKTLFAAKRFLEARKLFQDLVAEPGEGRKNWILNRGYLGASAAASGDSLEARRISKELERLDEPYLFGYDTYWRASIAAFLGEREEAVRWLREAFAEGLEFDQELHQRIAFEPLRDYPPFEELMRPKG